MSSPGAVSTSPYNVNTTASAHARSQILRCHARAGERPNASTGSTAAAILETTTAQSPIRTATPAGRPALPNAPPTVSRRPVPPAAQ
jgi:hypothetical protein